MKNRIAFVLMTGDVIGFFLTFILAYSVYALRLNAYGPDIIPSIFMWDLIGLYLIGALGGILYFLQKGHYRPLAPWWQQVKQICLYSLCSLILFGFAYFLIKGSASRLFVVATWVSLIPILMISRQIVRKILIKEGWWGVPTILIGGFENAIETIYALKSESYLNYTITQVVLPKGTDEQFEKFNEIHPGYAVSKKTPKFEGNEFVVICPDRRREIHLDKLTQKIIDAGSEFAVIPPIEGFSYYGLQPYFFFGYNIVLLRRARQIAAPFNAIMKTAMDRIGAAVGLLLLSPLFVFIALKVKQDGGPIFYGHKRIGKDGKEFKCWKFRSMVTNSQEVLEELLANDPAAKEEWERDFKLKDDPRITKIGSFLRTSSLDEIPQLLNVLMGEMSLVGPRPIVQDEVHYYGDKIKYYQSVRPGVTGLWQVSGRNDISYDLRVYLDRWYVRHWSLWTDIVIIIKTVFVVTRKSGAY